MFPLRVPEIVGRSPGFLARLFRARETPSSVTYDIASSPRIMRVSIRVISRSRDAAEAPYYTLRAAQPRSHFLHERAAAR